MTLPAKRPGVTANGNSNLINANNIAFNSASSALTLNTPLVTDSLLVSSALGFGPSYVTGNLVKSGLGTVTLTGTNAYTGTTTINAGTLQIGNGTDAGALAPATAITNNGSLVYNVGTGGRLQSAAIGGNGSLTQNSTGGQLTLSGTNTYTGVTTISNGTLSVGTIGNGGVAGNLGQATSSATNIVFDGGTLRYTGSTATSNRSFTINAGKTATIEVTANNLTLAGATGAATTGALNKTGSGTLTLNGTSTYTGGTTVNRGTLLLSGANNMPGTGVLAVNAGGTFSVADGTARTTTANGGLTLASGAVLGFDWLTGASTGDSVTSSADITPTAGSNIGIAINTPSGTPTGSLTLLTGGAGSTLSSSNFFLANNTNFTATLSKTATTVSIGSRATATALTNAYWLGGQVTNALGAMALSNGTSSNWASNAAGTSANGVVPGGAGVNVIFGATGGTQQGNVTVGADMNLGSITFNDAAAVTIGGNNAITLNSNSATAATTTGAGATVTAGSAISVTPYANAQNTINANIVLANTQAWNVAGGKNLTVSGSLSGSFNLTKADFGTLTLSGNNASFYGTTTTVSAGTLQFANTASLYGGDTSRWTISTFIVTNGATVAVNVDSAGTSGFNTTNLNTLMTNVTAFSGGSNLGLLAGGRWGLDTSTATSGTFTLTNSIRNSNGDSAGYSNGVTKLGTGELVFNLANTYTGSTIVKAGLLTLSNSLALQNSVLDTSSGVAGDASNGLKTTVTTLNIGGLAGNKDFASIFTTASGGYSGVTALTLGSTNSAGYSGAIANGATGMSLTKNGTGTQILSGTNTYTGNTTVNVGALSFAKQASLYNGTASSWTTSKISVASGGILALGVGDAASGYFDSTAISTFLDGSHLGASTTTTGFKTGAMLGFDTTNAGGSFTYNSAITNLGTSTTNGLAKLGPGTLTLTGNNTYTGVTTVSGGTLEFKNTGSTAFTGSHTVLNLVGGDATFQSTLTGNGSISNTFSSLTARVAGNTSNFVSSGGTNGTDNSIKITAQAAGFINQGVFFNGADYAAMNATGNYTRALAYGTDPSASAVNTIAANTHVKIDAPGSSYSGAGLTLLTLNLSGNNTNWTNTSGILVANGILKSGGGSSTISGGTFGPLGSSEMVIRVDTASDSLTISSPYIAQNSNYTKSGAGTLTLSSTTGAWFAGAWNLNGGTVSISTPYNLSGYGSCQVTFNGVSATVQNWISCRSKTGQGVRECNALKQRAKRLLEGVRGPRIDVLDDTRQ